MRVRAGEQGDGMPGLAAEIDRDYAQSPDLLCVGILKGSVFFLVDLLKRLLDRDCPGWRDAGD